MDYTSLASQCTVFLSWQYDSSDKIKYINLMQELYTEKLKLHVYTKPLHYTHTHTQHQSHFSDLVCSWNNSQLVTLGWNNDALHLVVFRRFSPYPVFSSIVLCRCSADADYLLVVHLASLLLAELLLGVGILEGFTPGWRGEERGLTESSTVSDMSEQTDWISEMSKSEASLPRRLLPRLPALLPGLLENLPEAGDGTQTIRSIQEMYRFQL